jgi:Uma2 family endonuclease
MRPTGLIYAIVENNHRIEVEDNFMSDIVRKTAFVPAGEIVAEGVSADDFLALYTDGRYEWVQGVVIKMSPSSDLHLFLTDYFYDIFRAYFLFNPIGQVRRDPFMMRLTESFRIPDIQVILNENSHQLSKTSMLGAPDLCIEVVSPESVARDYGDKFAEYESMGVHEYWIIDPLRQQAIFYQLQENGLYSQVAPDSSGNYIVAILPKLKIHVPTLWQTPLPNMQEVLAQVKAQLEK